MIITINWCYSTAVDEQIDLFCSANMKLPTAILHLIVASSQTSQEGCNNFGVMKSWTTKDEQLKHCNNDSTCPTWFTCNSQNSCQCGDEHDYAVVCDNKLGESAVLDCHCVTHERNSGSTYLGLCFYNCQNSNIEKDRDITYNRTGRLTQ